VGRPVTRDPHEKVEARFRVILTKEEVNVIKLSLQYALRMYHETDPSEITDSGRAKMDVVTRLLSQLPGPRPTHV
jgi:hypothetical protein